MKSTEAAHLLRAAGLHGSRSEAGWRLLRIESTASTNDLAARLAPGRAVVARVQTGGRGRRRRAFVSDAGGLWLSAVVELPGGAVAWQGFALAVAAAVREVLAEGGAPDLRLRWPNDLLAGDRKVGGVLVEQTAPTRAVVGVGLNVDNAPWREDAALAGVAGRLRDAAPGLPRADGLVAAVLEGIDRAHGAMARAGGLAGVHGWINAAWDEPRAVRLEVAGGAVHGRFCGIDGAGRIRLEPPGGGRARLYPAHRVERLVETGGAEAGAVAPAAEAESPEAFCVS